MTDLLAGYELREGADPVAAHAVLTRSYWAEGITLEQVERALAASFVVSVWNNEQQIAMARVLTDHITFAYLHDVYVLPEHGRKGIAQAMLSYLHRHPELQDIGRWVLFTKDAQSLYAKFGWKQYPWPERLMIIDPKVFPA